MYTKPHTVHTPVFLKYLSSLLILHMQCFHLLKALQQSLHLARLVLELPVFDHHVLLCMLQLLREGLQLGVLACFEFVKAFLFEIEALLQLCVCLCMYVCMC